MIVTTDNLPTTCEFCGAELVWEGVNIVCPNKNCSNLNDEKLKAWVTNIAPIDGLGWKTFDKLLMLTGWDVNSVTELYKYARNLNCRWQNVKENSEKDLFNKTLDKLCASITISQFLLALKIPGLGKIGAKAVEDSLDAKIAFESILCSKYAKNFDYDIDLEEASSIWTKLLQDKNTAMSLYTEHLDYFVSCYNLVKDQIQFECINNDTEIVEKGTVVITGSLSIKRDEFVKKLEQAGWKMASKITKDTSYLITNTPDSGTSKNKEADKLGVRKITEQEAMSILF
nr:hypothetical protein DGKKSRWO_DGKKSRWO_CDS_0129 [uncultured phage]CAI9752306.1 hypothetical protein CVNMHQAP_CVNMHQAP_CDS_0129 [uncultured phage]